MKFRPPAPSARHQDGKADVVDQIARDAAQQDVTHPRMGEGADGEKIRPDIFCKILEGHGDAPAGRTDHMKVAIETMAGEVAGNNGAGSGAVAFGNGVRINDAGVDDGARGSDGKRAAKGKSMVALSDPGGTHIHK